MEYLASKKVGSLMVPLPANSRVGLKPLGLPSVTATAQSVLALSSPSVSVPLVLGC